jgi:hypothetical protein
MGMLFQTLVLPRLEMWHEKFMLDIPTLYEVGYIQAHKNA